MRSREVARLIKSIVEMIPQWYSIKEGDGDHEFSVKGRDRMAFCSIAPKSPKLMDVRSFAQDNLPLWCEQVEAIGGTIGIELIQELVAIHWLKREDPSVDWLKLLRYIRELSFKTYENQSVNLNLVISSGSGCSDITDLGLLAPLSASQRVYLQVDKDLRFLAYEEILWSSVRESEEYKYIPEFLQPFASILREGEFSVHLTQRGDLVITNMLGLLASKRKGRWYLYEPQSLVRGIEQIYRQRSGNRIGRNLFEVLLDLSFKRKGALLIFDPDQSVQRDGIVPSTGPSVASLSSLLEETIGGIRVGDRARAWRKGLLLELASLDGAVVFTADRVCAFGAMIKSHDDAGSFRGARTTAAHSARRWGGIPAKVSSDGDISILFHSRNSNGDTVEASLNFL